MFIFIKYIEILFYNLTYFKNNFILIVYVLNYIFIDIALHFKSL